ncbi:hypothetical protein [Cystobacter ferrugineus]|uniref:CAAX protease n=1 Tax=Cystobacter ferrugineus TaxID=83449 RepID=A0A1L9AYA0_9BACT|nr:hypothetical protein [Cystobacter ferrugineus]OJH34989.1 hypothetical protein BON30_41140 [Cystobacter ferrugineus]
MDLTLSASLARPVARCTPFPWLPLTSRLVFFAAFQAAIAAGYALRGHPDAWSASAAWWPVTAFLTSLVSLALLWRGARGRGQGLRDLYFQGGEGRRLGRDVLSLLGVLGVAAPLAHLPNIVLATWLFGDPQRALDLFVRPLPVWVATAALVLFPLTVALTELPTYYAEAMPRLREAGIGSASALTLCALFHAAQHATLPLLFDARFFTWRLLMFVPFAFVVGAAIRWRPSLMPWLMGIHLLLDTSAMWLVYAASV